MFDHASYDNHESLNIFSDPETGLQALIAVHSTARGPAAGGCRMWPFASSTEAITDVLRLSKGMSYKNAMADLPIGGGKAIIIGDSKKDKSPELFRSFGRCVNMLGGRYWSGEDVGITPDDMVYARETTPYIGGLPGKSGDPSPITALGVFRGIKLAAQHLYGTEDVSGLKVAVQGVGHVGGPLCRLLAEAGAELFITDIDQDQLHIIAEATDATIVEPDTIYAQKVDVFSPNALGAIVNDKTIDQFDCKLIAGGANNQLLGEAHAEQLKARNILYIPDYVINAGGIINIACEILGDYDRSWVDGKLDRLIETMAEILEQSAANDQTPLHIAEKIAKARITAYKG